MLCTPVLQSELFFPTSPRTASANGTLLLHRHKENRGQKVEVLHLATFIHLNMQTGEGLKVILRPLSTAVKYTQHMYRGSFKHLPCNNKNLQNGGGYNGRSNATTGSHNFGCPSLELTTVALLASTTPFVTHII